MASASACSCCAAAVTIVLLWLGGDDAVGDSLSKKGSEVCEI